MTEPLRADELRAVPHGFFTRLGGVSEGLYAGLNCGAGSSDAPEAVAENRARVTAAIGAGALVTLRQVHSARAIAVDGPWDGPAPEADGLATDRPGLALGALGADCAPVLFADAEAGVVGAAHAGWRGALGGVIEATVEAMVALGAARGRIAAAVGPCISQAAYEVGPDFVAVFLDEDPDHSRFFAGGAGDRAQFDLPGFCLARLDEAGIGARAWIGRCTWSDEARFYSYRRATQRGEADYGRQIGAIAAPGGCA